MPEEFTARDQNRALLRHSRREALIVLLVWTLFLLWVVGYSYLRGYEHPADSPLVRWGLALPRSGGDFTTTLGVPDWVFAGIFLPWLAATLFTVIFALGILKNDALGSGPAVEPPPGPRPSAPSSAER